MRNADQSRAVSTAWTFRRWLCWATGCQVLLIAKAGLASADDYYGRAMFGTLVSHEQFAQPTDGSYTNDFFTQSGSLFLDVSKIGDSNLEAIADIRDMNDFFDKVNQQALNLSNVNKLEPYQLSLRSPKSGGWYWEAGRFGIPEAGSAWEDGAQLGYSWNGTAQSGHAISGGSTSGFGGGSSGERTGLFAGLNARQPYQTYPTFNPNSPQFGLYNNFQPQFESWTKTAYLSNALVSEIVDGHLDREYFFTDGLYQWDARSRVTALLYLDFVPETYIQTGIVSYAQGVTPTLTTNLSAYVLDVIAYSRQAGILETVPLSPYKGATADVRQQMGTLGTLDLGGRYGYRTLDGLSFKEVSLGTFFPRIINEHLQLRDSLILRQDFTATDKLLQLGLDYYSMDWEVGVTGNYGYELQNTGNVDHPLILDTTFTRYFSKELFGSLSLEYGNNEVVNVYQGSVAVGYRFGNKGAAPPVNAAPLTPPVPTTPIQGGPLSP